MSLYTAAKRTRFAIGMGIGSIFAVIIVKLSWNVGILLYYHFFPEEVPPPQVAYGKLPSLKLKSLPLKPGSTPKYRLETTTASLPVFPDRIPVYKLAERNNSISLERNAVNFARSLGFTTEHIRESSIDWVWKDEVNDRTLQMNIVTNDFKLNTNLEKVAPTTPRGSAPDLSSAQSNASSLITSILQEDVTVEGEQTLKKDFLSNAQLTSRYIRIKGNRQEVVETQGEAQMVEVNFFIALGADSRDFPGFDKRFLPETFPVISPNPDEGVVQVYVANSSNPAYNQPLINFSSQRLDLEEKATYPLKRVDVAWQELGNGKGVISYLRIKGDNPLGPHVQLALNQVDIRSISLSYLDTGLPYRQYLEPVYVFEGEGFTVEGLRAKLVAYVEAVNPICLGEAEELGKPCSLISQ